MIQIINNLYKDLLVCGRLKLTVLQHFLGSKNISCPYGGREKDKAIGGCGGPNINSARQRCIADKNHGNSYFLANWAPTKSVC